MISELHRSAIALLTCIGMLAALSPACARCQQQQEQQQQQQQREASHSSGPATNPGQEKFRQNCSRCHEAPQTLSPQLARTVLRHMRVRASLSEQDERDILNFLNP